MAKKDTAYTNLALSGHTDSTYFTDPIGLQLFHLLSHKNGSGGTSLYVDAFQCVDQLKLKDMQAFETLCNTRFYAHSSGDEKYLMRPQIPYPILNRHPETGEVYHVRYNNDDRGEFASNTSVEEIDEFYRALKVWMRIVEAPENVYWEQLKPGMVVLVDNHRYVV